MRALSGMARMCYNAALLMTMSFCRVISCIEYGMPPMPNPELSRPAKGIQMDFPGS